MNYSLNPLMYKNWALKKHLYTTAGVYYVLLEPGVYNIKIHGAGGAGGSSGFGAGGAGGVGQLVTEEVIIGKTTRAKICVGAGGLTYANGGNGGGHGANNGGGSAGNGGGGGHLSYIQIEDVFYIANGGGGGGGGGGNHANYARYGGASGGAGGGGYYRANPDGTETSVPGKTGGSAGGRGVAGGDGVTGNMDFSECWSVGAKAGYDGPAGGSGKYGGGASGGGGGANGNHSDSYAYGGAGGAGAGGDLDAGGGGNGAAGLGNAYNHHTTPTATVDYLGLPVTNGWGIGGATNQDGAAGWVYINQTSRIIAPATRDQGLLSDTNITVVDNGLLSDEIITTENNGSL